jgi:hypothetical protein
VVGISKRNKDFWRITQIFFSLNSDWFVHLVCFVFYVLFVNFSVSSALF